ncbi:hypothetical protein JUNP353_0126 [Elizabethkingia anophelis]|nr:hypothetical protein JUNP353_0126 [Elizabethkingia anophelis]
MDCVATLIPALGINSILCALTVIAPIPNVNATANNTFFIVSNFFLIKTEANLQSPIKDDNRYFTETEIVTSQTYSYTAEA